MAIPDSGLMANNYRGTMRIELKIPANNPGQMLYNLRGAMMIELMSFINAWRCLLGVGI